VNYHSQVAAIKLQHEVLITFLQSDFYSSVDTCMGVCFLLCIY